MDWGGGGGGEERAGGGGGVVQEIESSDFKKGTVYQSRPKEKPTSRCQLNPK